MSAGLLLTLVAFAATAVVAGMVATAEALDAALDAAWDGDWMDGADAGGVSAAYDPVAEAETVLRGGR